MLNITGRRQEQDKCRFTELKFELSAKLRPVQNAPSSAVLRPAIFSYAGLIRSYVSPAIDAGRIMSGAMLLDPNLVSVITLGEISQRELRMGLSVKEMMRQMESAVCSGYTQTTTTLWGWRNESLPHNSEESKSVPMIICF